MSSNVRPSPLFETDITRIIRELYGLNVKVVKEFESYDDRNYLVQDVLNDISKDSASCFMFKILNYEDSMEPRKISTQNDIALFLKKSGYPLPAPVINLGGSYQTMMAFESKERGTETVAVRLFDFLPGTTLAKITLTKSLCRQIGHYVGLFDKICLDFTDYNEEISSMMIRCWNMSQLSILWSLIDVVEDRKKLALVKSVISTFEEDVLKNEDKFTHKGFIHSDMNDCNILVSQSQGTIRTNDINAGPDTNGINRDKRNPASNKETYHVSGVIDFGDMTYSNHLYEVAISIVYVIINEHGIPPLEAAGCVLSGFLKQIKLSDFELEQLKTCVCARLAQSIVLGLTSLKADPENIYIIHHSSRMWTPLEKIWSMTSQEFLQELYKEKE